MFYHLLKIVACLFLFFNISCSHLLAQNDTLKVLSYNIWNGFDWGKDTQRKVKMTEWLKEINPDVVGFQELNDFTEAELKAWGNDIGHPYAVLLKEDGYPVGITSKKPIRLMTGMQGGLWHGMIHVETFGIDFIVLHLSPHDWEFRRREAEIIVEYAEKSILKHSDKQLIMMGDFNAHSPYDANFDAMNPFSLKRLKQSDSLRIKKNGPNAHQNLRNGTIDYSVISKFLSIPMIDLVQKSVPDKNKNSFPTPLVLRNLSPEAIEKNKKRIDYILASTNLESSFLEAEILNQGVPEVLSDHYPVLASFLHSESQ
jgi:endonuclease/exonuclease/phosphatase family metal-dependent hydrolase